MFALLLMRWWYGSGWSWLFSSIAAKYRLVSEALSVGILIKTFFAPWKQIQSTTTLQNFVQTTVDNIISRFVGMAVRGLMLFTAALLFVILSVLSVALIIIWPFLPLLVVILPILSIEGVGV